MTTIADLAAEIVNYLEIHDDLELQAVVTGSGVTIESETTDDDENRVVNSTHVPFDQIEARGMEAISDAIDENVTALYGEAAGVLDEPDEEEGEEYEIAD